MKVVLVMALASPWSRLVASTLASLGHEVHVVDFAAAPSAAAYLTTEDAAQHGSAEALRDAGVVTHLLRTRWSSGLRYLTGARALRRVAADVGADIVVTLYGGGYALMAYASRVRPYAVYVVGSDVLMARGLSARIARLALTNAAHVFANGMHLAAETRRLAPRATVSCLYLGTETSAYPAAPQCVDEPRLLCTRGFLPVYNNRYLIEALRARGQKARPLPLTFISKGPLLHDVRAFADRELSASQRAAVHFLGGVDDARLRTELATSQIYLSVSTSDGTSISLLEALASGLYPILSDIPQNREWIDETLANGTLVPLGTPERLAAAIDRAVADRAGRARASEHNRRMVRERADARTNMSNLARILAQLLTPSSRAQQ